MSQLGTLGNVALGIQKGVRVVHPSFPAALLKWTRCRDVVAGSDAVKSKGTEYLPKLTQQQVEEYNSYKTRANFFNATGRTVSAMEGMLFRKPPSINVPDGIKPLLENVTLDGENLDQFTREVVEENIVVGRVGILVDYSQPATKAGEVITVAMAEAIGNRPLMKMYTAENIINWKYKTTNNVTKLSMLVLHEQVVLPDQDDEFKEKTESNYRVLDLDPANGFYRVRVFRIDKDGKDELINEPFYPLMNNTQMDFIPFEFFCPDGNDSDIDLPPILDLVDTNLSHYRASADWEHGCHFTGLPMLCVSGMSPYDDKGKPVSIFLGSQSALVLENPDASAQFIEFKGQGLQSLEKNLDRKEQMMAVLGARMLEPQKKAAETAVTSSLHRMGENSILASISISVSTGLKTCLGWFCMWAGIQPPDDLDYEINRDFLPVAIDGPTLTSYVGAWQNNALTEEELFDLLKRGDLIEAEVEYDEHTAQAKIEAATRMKQQQDLMAAKDGPNPNDSSIKNPTTDKTQ
jgi:hypothetical protein